MQLNVAKRRGSVGRCKNGDSETDDLKRTPNIAEKAMHKDLSVKS